MEYNAFDTLRLIDVSDKTEKKNGLTYLSWAWAWDQLNHAFPGATFTVYERETEFGPCNYFTDGKTCWVKTGVTVQGIEYIEMLPVMDFKNRSIPLESVTSMDVNKAIQRSLTKAAARHGLGLYIYAGEDLPEESDDEKKRKAEEAAVIAQVVKEVDTLVRGLTKDMSKEEKLAFANTVIKPILGSVNYLTCKDLGKISELLACLKEKKGAA